MPILVHILDEQGRSPLEIPADELNQVLDDAADAIPDAVIKIWKFFH